MIRKQRVYSQYIEGSTESNSEHMLLDEFVLTSHDVNGTLQITDWRDKSPGPFLWGLFRKEASTGNLVVLRLAGRGDEDFVNCTRNWFFSLQLHYYLDHRRSEMASSVSVWVYDTRGAYFLQFKKP